MLETLVLSILNHDCAIAAAAARMVTAAGGRPIIEMGSRRTHEQAAVAAARAAYLAGFASTSNLAAERRYGVPTAGTAAHAFTLLHDDERAAFAAQIDVARAGDHAAGRHLRHHPRHRTGGRRSPARSWARSASTPATWACWPARPRAQLDGLGATGTRIVVSGDLDEFSIAALAAAPVDAYGAGTAVVTGSGAPTAGLVYKLVEVDGRPVAKRSEHKESHGGRKTALRAHKPTGTAIEEIVVAGPAPSRRRRASGCCSARWCAPVNRCPDLPTSTRPREHLRAATVSLPWDGLKLSRGEPAIPTRRAVAEPCRRSPVATVDRGRSMSA